MKKLQKGSLSIILLSIIFILILTSLLLFYKLNKVQITKDTEKDPVSLTQITKQDNTSISTATSTESYRLIQRLISGKYNKPFEIREVDLVWIDKKYKGYSVIIRNLSESDSNIVTYVEDKLKNDGFIYEPNMSGDGTVNASNGYIKDDIFCISSYSGFALDGQAWLSENASYTLECGLK